MENSLPSLVSHCLSKALSVHSVLIMEAKPYLGDMQRVVIVQAPVSKPPPSVDDLIAVDKDISAAASHYFTTLRGYEYILTNDKSIPAVVPNPIPEGRVKELLQMQKTLSGEVDKMKERYVKKTALRRDKIRIFKKSIKVLKQPDCNVQEVLTQAKAAGLA